MEYLFFLNVVMVSRLGYLMRETPAAAATAWLACAFQLLALGVFVPNGAVLALAAVLIVVTALGRLLERRGNHLAGTRASAFVSIAAAGAVVAGAIEFAPWSGRFLSALSALTDTTAAFDDADWQRLNVVAFALLLLTNEVNLAIRYGFYRLNLEPKVELPEPVTEAERERTDERQYNAGRVIGILERYFILVLLLAGSDFSAIAVILAAKGFARFKQLDRREFAEYILIGTLASTLSAVLVALLARALM